MTLAQSAWAGIQDFSLYVSWLKEASRHKNPECFCLEMSSKTFTIDVILNFVNVFIFFPFEQGFLMLKLSDDIKEILLDVHWKMLRNPALSSSPSLILAQEKTLMKRSVLKQKRWKDNLKWPSTQTKATSLFLRLILLTLHSVAAWRRKEKKNTAR